MKVMHLEIDSRLKEVLLKNLSAVGMLSMRIRREVGAPKRYSKEGSGWNPAAGRGEISPIGVEVFAEPEAFGKIVKTIIRLGRDGFLAEFPVKILSIRPVV